MNRKIAKYISAGLCISILTCSAPFVPLAFAEQTTASNEIPIIKAKNGEDEAADIKARTAAILHPLKEMEVSTIPSDHAYIPKDTILTVELMQEMSSKKMKKGMPVPLTLKENLIVNDVVVAPAGTEVKGIVTKATKSGFFGRSGKLEFKITSFETINGVKVPLQYVTKKEAGSDGGAVAVATALTVVGGFLMKGKNVTFKEGTLFDARVTADTDLQTTLDGLAAAMDTSNPHGTVIIIKR